MMLKTYAVARIEDQKLFQLKASAARWLTRHATIPAIAFIRCDHI